MGRIGDIADLVTGLALLGGGYLVYRAVKDAGDIIPDMPTFEWPTFPDWTLPDIPGIGDNGGLGGGGGGVRNGNGSDLIPEIPEIPAPWLTPGLPDEPWGGLENGYPSLTTSPSWDPGDLTKGLGRIFQINGDLFGFRKAPGLEFETRREARHYLKAYGGDLL